MGLGRRGASTWGAGAEGWGWAGCQGPPPTVWHPTPDRFELYPGGFLGGWGVGGVGWGYGMLGKRGEGGGEAGGRVGEARGRVAPPAQCRAGKGPGLPRGGGPLGWAGHVLPCQS